MLLMFLVIEVISSECLALECYCYNTTYKVYKMDQIMYILINEEVEEVGERAYTTDSILRICVLLTYLKCETAR